MDLKFSSTKQNRILETLPMLKQNKQFMAEVAAEILMSQQVTIVDNLIYFHCHIVISIFLLYIRNIEQFFVRVTCIFLNTF